MKAAMWIAVLAMGMSNAAADVRRTIELSGSLHGSACVTKEGADKEGCLIGDVFPEPFSLRVGVPREFNFEMSGINATAQLLLDYDEAPHYGLRITLVDSVNSKPTVSMHVTFRRPQDLNYLVLHGSAEKKTSTERIDFYYTLNLGPVDSR